MDISDYCLLVTRTSTGEKKQQGITTFLVDTKLPGIEVRKIETLGQRAIRTTQVFYSDVKVPASAVLGEVDQGWEAVDAYLWYERLCLSAARTGAATAAFDYALDYAKNRKQFGRPIGKFQAISHKLADMKVMLDVSRMLVYRFAWLMAQGKATRHDAAVLKLYTGEAYKTVSDMGLQILGGYGYCMEYPMQRFFRDSRLATIGAGTSEIQRNIIARGLGSVMARPAGRRAHPRARPDHRRHLRRAGAVRSRRRSDQDRVARRRSRPQSFGRAVSRRERAFPHVQPQQEKRRHRSEDRGGPRGLLRSRASVATSSSTTSAPACSSA